MKREELIDLFEDLDEELIEEAATAAVLPTYRKRRALLVACACALLVLSLPVFFLFSGLFKGADTPTDMGGQSSNIEVSGEESAPMDGSMESNPDKESLPPPEESVPYNESEPYDPTPEPVPSKEWEYATLLRMKMQSSFEICLEGGVVTQVTAPDSESGEEILALLKKGGADPKGGSLENALLLLLGQMLQRGEHLKDHTLTLVLLSYEDSLATPEAQRALLDESADILRRLAEIENAAIQIKTESAFGGI